MSLNNGSATQSKYTPNQNFFIKPKPIKESLHYYTYFHNKNQFTS